MARILIVDSNTEALNARSRKRGDPGAGEGYAAALKALDPSVEATIIAPYDGDRMPELTEFDGVVFTGSGVEWNTDDQRAEPLAQIMRTVFSEGLPTIGSCNGLQLAASVLGGSSDESPNGREDGLAMNLHLTEAGRAHPLMRGRRDGFAVPCVHRDEVVRLPDGAVLLATNAHSEVQAFAYEKDGVRFWGMQYHPELEPGDVGRMILSRDAESQMGQDLQIADSDAGAAARLGTSVEEMQLHTRATELRNWLDSL